MRGHFQCFCFQVKQEADNESSLIDWIQKHCRWAVVIQAKNQLLSGAFETSVSQQKSNLLKAHVLKDATLDAYKGDPDQWKQKYESRSDTLWTLTPKPKSIEHKIMDFTIPLHLADYTDSQLSTMLTKLNHYWQSVCSDYIFHVQSAPTCIKGHIKLDRATSLTTISRIIKDSFTLECLCEPISPQGNIALSEWILSPELCLHGPWSSNPRVFKLDHIAKYHKSLAREPWQHWIVELLETHERPPQATVFNLYDIDDETYQQQRDRLILQFPDKYGPDGSMHRQRVRPTVFANNQDDAIDLHLPIAQRGHLWLEQSNFLKYLSLFHKIPFCYASSCDDLVSFIRSYPNQKMYALHLVDEYFTIMHQHEMHNTVTSIASGKIYVDRTKSYKKKLSEQDQWSDTAAIH